MDLKKIIAIGVLSVFVLAFASTVSADWFGSAFSRGFTTMGFAVVSAPDSNAGSGSISKQEIIDSFRKARELRKAAKEKAKAAIGGIRQEAKSDINAVKQDRLEQIRAVVSDANTTAGGRGEEIREINREARGKIKEIKKEAKARIKLTKEELKALVKESAMKLREARKKARDAKKGSGQETPFNDQNSTQ